VVRGPLLAGSVWKAPLQKVGLRCNASPWCSGCDGLLQEPGAPVPRNPSIIDLNLDLWQVAHQQRATFQHASPPLLAKPLNTCVLNLAATFCRKVV
jgi:hypothetical protein